MYGGAGMVQKDSKILEMCKNLNFPQGKLSDEYLFTIQTVDLFYYKKNIGQIDIKTGFTDGPNDGGIDFVYSDPETMYLVQGKTSDNLTLEDIKNVFLKMTETIKNFDEKNMKIILGFLNRHILMHMMIWAMIKI